MAQFDSRSMIEASAAASSSGAARLVGPHQLNDAAALAATEPVASAWSVVFLLLIGASFFAKAGDQFSRVWLGGFYVSGLIALLAFRRGLFLMVRRWTEAGRLNRRTAIVGGGAAGEELITAIKQQ